ncbi:HAD family acid phosphatase [Streptomyces shenzhenensis]|uniref:HAD family acid phosphatase n=1 Tax=Streptomyces shenzhenensis TaxID=943815 RepID=UPI0036CCD5D4
MTAATPAVSHRLSVTAVSVAALTALAAPAEAATSTAAAGASATVDYETWQQDCRAVMDQALPYLKDRIAAARPGGFPHPANKPVLEVARYAQEHGVSLFFVTARPGIIYLPTEYNLEHDGYEVSGLYVPGLFDLFKDVADYKTAQRVAIENKGYTITANIRNSATDLSGGHAGMTYKLPDRGGQLSRRYWAADWPPVRSARW